MNDNLIFQDINIFAGNIQILKSCSGTIKAGKVTAIIGPNGSGKTTLMSCLAGLRKINSGQVMIGDKNCHIMNIKARAKCIGYLPQKNEVNWNISVRRLVELGRTPYLGSINQYNKNNHTNEHAIIEQAMVMADVAHLSDRKVSNLSGGELSRILFARVLAGDPDWIMLDEPMANLDLAHQLDMIALLKLIASQGKSIIMILHDIEQAIQIADNIIIMSNGKIKANGRVNVITEDILSEVFGISANIQKDNMGQLRINNIKRYRH